MTKLQAAQLSKANLIDLSYLGIIAIAALIFALPALHYGPFDAMDLPFHLKWSKQFADQFWNGELYPRWLQNMNDGLGSPTFFFYAPVPFYLTSLLRLIGIQDASGWAALGASVAIALAASGVTCYLWLKMIVRRSAALIGTLLYLVLPYHLGANLYWRFAFAEFWALVWLPLILYFTYQLVRGSKTALIGLTIAQALLIATHLPSFVIFTIVPIAYIISFAHKPIRAKVLIRFAIALLFAVGLTAAYWLPAMTTQGFISMNAILEKGYFYGNNFLFSRKCAPYHNANFWTYLELVSSFMLALGICAFAIARRSRSILQREANFWLVVSGVTFFMMIPISQPIWDVLPPLQRIQFPWRLSSILLIAVTALCAIAIETFTASSSANRRRKIAGAIAVFLIGSMVLSNGVIGKQRLKPHTRMDSASLQINYEEAQEYRPKWVALDRFNLEDIAEMAERLPQRWQLNNAGTVTIKAWTPRRIVFQSNTPKDALLTLRQFYYAGWTAKSQDRSWSVQPSPKDGLLQVALPAGNHGVEVTLEKSIQEKTGEWISTIALLLFGGVVLLSFRRTPKPLAVAPERQLSRR